jgi:hypothetical protein
MMSIKLEMNTIETWELSFLLKEMLVDRNTLKQRKAYWDISDQAAWKRLDSEIRAIRKELRTRALAAQYTLPGF